MKTRQRVRDEFDKAGISISQWAKAHGYSREIVAGVLCGRLAGRRGESHRVAVHLGLKDGPADIDPRDFPTKEAA